MKACNVKIFFTKKVLKGAGIKASTFIPSFVYSIKIAIKNNSEFFQLCSLNSTLANGLTYLGGLKIIGPDKELDEYIKIVEPSIAVGNNNLILFANNIKISPLSENIIAFDVGLNDKYTVNSIENSGNIIPHRSALNINTYLLCNGDIYYDNLTSEAMDYEIAFSCENSCISPNDETKLYIQCTAGQYALIRKAYIKCTLDNGLKYIDQTSNIEPNNIYSYDNRTILKWSFNTISPSEAIRLGFKVKAKKAYSNNEPLKAGDKLINSVNTNAVNNLTYTQCPDTCKCDIKVVE